MKATAFYLVGAALMAIVGAVFLGTGLLDRDIADAQEHVVSADYAEPQQTFQRAERYYSYASRLPWIGNGPLNEIRARQASLQYWQGRYTAIVPAQADPIANIAPDNVDLQFIVANAIFREGLAQAKDKGTTIQALDAAKNAYMTLLRNATRHDDASYNYEYVVRLLGDIDKGRRKMAPPVQPIPDGFQGGPPSETASDDSKVYVPLERGEIDKERGANAGKQTPLKKKG